MDPRSQQFLRAILGADGAAAMCTAAERSSALEYALVPRAILAWVGSAPRYEGEIPGVEGSHLAFRKSESGFAGVLRVGEVTHDFEDRSLAHLGAIVSIALGVPVQPVPEELRDVEIERLGKSIDVLAKFRRVRKGLEKSKSGPGPADAPIAPTAPEAPTAAAPTPSAKPAATPPKIKPAKPAAAPKTMQVTLTRAEAERACTSCRRQQFVENSFVGCMCFRALQKSARVLEFGDAGVTLRLEGWEPEAVVTFLESVGRK